MQIRTAPEEKQGKAWEDPHSGLLCLVFTDFDSFPSNRDEVFYQLGNFPAQSIWAL